MKKVFFAFLIITAVLAAGCGRADAGKKSASEGTQADAESPTDSSAAADPDTDSSTAADAEDGSDATAPDDCIGIWDQEYTEDADGKKTDKDGTVLSISYLNGYMTALNFDSEEDYLSGSFSTDRAVYDDPVYQLTEGEETARFNPYWQLRFSGPDYRFNDNCVTLEDTDTLVWITKEYQNEDHDGEYSVITTVYSRRQDDTSGSGNDAGVSSYNEEKEESKMKDAIDVTFSSVDKNTMAVTFSRLPESVADIQSMGSEAFRTPEFAAAAFVAIMCSYPEDPEAAYEMINVLKGPEGLSEYDKSFIKERMKGKDYIAFSYFSGASVDNNYTPSTPYTVNVHTNTYTYAEDGYAKFYLQSAGADSMRPVSVRSKKSTGEWFLWDQALLADIRKPASQDEWK